MTKTIAQQLESAYARATMRDTAKHLRSPQDWQHVQDIQSQSAQAKAYEQVSFRDEYSARLADAREAILKERGSWTYTHPAPKSAARRDRFDKDQIDRQAHLRVHNAHAQTMAKIDVQQNHQMKQLEAQARHQNQIPQPNHQQPQMRRER